MPTIFEQLEALAIKAMKPKQRIRLTQETDGANHPLTPAVNLRLTALDLPIWPKVIVVGQEPYPQQGKGTGRAFEVAHDFEPRNEDALSVLSAHMPGRSPETRSLQALAAQGVMFINDALTVQAKINPRQKKHNGERMAWAGWAPKFCKMVIRESTDTKPIVIVLGDDNDNWKLWDKLFQTPAHLILRGYPGKGERDGVLNAPGDDALSQHTNPFDECNARLIERGATAIDWSAT